jgi:class 3 adenylate cyclase
LSSSGPAQPATDTERRRITVMFADITGFTSLVERRDTEEAFDVVTGCIRLLDGIARKQGGSVDKYLGDCIMAVFGLPLAIEDAPRAAVNAAIEMQRRVREYNRERGLDPPLELHVGINTGLAISGDVSGPVLREFAVLGDPVNVASRLKDEAPPGQVYVGQETWRFTRDHFDYASLPPLKVKGKRRRIRAHRLLSRRERLHRDRGRAADSIFSEFVGRADLMKELRSALESLGEGRGGIHVLVGEAGLGKTRILDETSRAPEAADAEWLRGTGVAIWQNVAYHVFADLMRTRLEIAPGDDDATARARLAEIGSVVPEAAGEAQPILASMMGLRLSAEERRRVDRLGGDAMERIILGTITELLRAIARRTPPVLVLDDLHWADGSSLKLLERLLRIAHDRPVLFLLAARDGYPETTGRLLDALDRNHRGRFRLHELEPLSHEGSRQLLRNLVQHGDVPSEFLARVEETTRGNPFFMEEVVRSLSETGVLVSGAQGMDLVGSPQAVEIPNSIHDVVMARIDRLPRAPRGLLQGASVVGTSAHVAVLQAALPEADDLEEGLAHLEKAGMLFPLPGESRWEFKHPLIREVTYESILGSRREELHLRVARAIEDHLSESVPGFHAMLAYHRIQGRDLKGAEHHLVQAGEEATKLAAADEALRLFCDAAALYLTLNPDGGESSRRADLERNIARAHANRGELTEAIEHGNLALEALGERVPRDAWARALHALPGFWSALRMIHRRRGLSRRPATEQERRVIELMFERSRAQVTTTPAPSFVFDTFHTFRKIAAVDPSSVVGAGGMLAGMVGPLAWGGVSLFLSRRFLELAEPLVNRDDEGEAFFYDVMRFLHHHQQGGWREEYEIAPERVDAALRLGQLWDATNYLVLLGEKRVGQGRFAEADAIVRELGRIGDLFQYDLARSSHRYVQMLLQIERGEFAAAVRTADAYYTEHQEKGLNLLALGNRAKAELLGGDRPAARATLAESAQILSTERFVPPFYRYPHWRSRLLLDVFELREAGGDRRVAAPRGRLAARRALAASSRMAIRAPEALRLEAARLWRVGRRSRARRRAEAGLAAAERLGAVPERARAHALLARLLGEEEAPPELAGRDAAGHWQMARRLRTEHEPFAWAEAGSPASDPLDGVDLPREL